MDESILEPTEYYQSNLKDLHLKNTIQYFDDLVKESGIRPEENKQTVKELKMKKNKIGLQEKILNKYRTIRGFLIFVLIASIIAGIIFLFGAITGSIVMWIGILCSILFFGVAITMGILISKKVNFILKQNEMIRNKLTNEAKELEDLAWKQMMSLNSLYDWNIPSAIIKKTTPLIQLDPYFDAEKYEYLKEKYGLLENTQENVSTVFVQSGSILGNPFLLCRDYKQSWTQKQYFGSLLISWVETETNSRGETYTVTRTQTLYASVVKPFPDYAYETYLIYGNDAAPNLKFSRSPKNTAKMNENELAKYVRSQAKELDKKARDAVRQGKNYTRFGNDEFEVLFGGENRDNELEFRLLFTPLAQKNELKLIKSDIGFKDDFYFEKRKCLNYIQTAHSQNQDYIANPKTFIHYDYEEARKKFIAYHQSYFKNLFFDLAPLLSIPLYQQYKPKEYIYKERYRANIPSFEHESLANSFSISELCHPQTKSNVILKTHFIQRDKTADRVVIRAHSFAAEERVDFIPVYGGDGKLHSVPVYWIEYIPIYRDTPMEVKAVSTTRKEFHKKVKDSEVADYLKNLTSHNEFLYERGLMAMLLNRDFVEKDVEILEHFFPKK